MAYMYVRRKKYLCNIIASCSAAYRVVRSVMDDDLPIDVIEALCGMMGIVRADVASE